MIRVLGRHRLTHSLKHNFRLCSFLLLDITSLTQEIGFLIGGFSTKSLESLWGKVCIELFFESRVSDSQHYGTCGVFDVTRYVGLSHDLIEQFQERYDLILIAFNSIIALNIIRNLLLALIYSLFLLEILHFLRLSLNDVKGFIYQE